MDELKPCPFCGGEVKLMAIAGEPYPPTYEVKLETVSKDSDDICYVHCPTCGANWHIECRVDSFPLDTIAAWNRRPAPENKPLTVEQLREMDGEPVWVKEIDGTGCGEWTIIDIGAQTETLKALSPDTGYEEYNYGKTWVPYARKPEQEDNQ